MRRSTTVKTGMDKLGKTDVTVEGLRKHVHDIRLFNSGGSPTMRRNVTASKDLAGLEIVAHITSGK